MARLSNDLLVLANRFLQRHYLRLPRNRRFHRIRPEFLCPFCTDGDKRPISRGGNNPAHHRTRNRILSSSPRHWSQLSSQRSRNEIGSSLRYQLDTLGNNLRALWRVDRNFRIRLQPTSLCPLHDNRHLWYLATGQKSMGMRRATLERKVDILKAIQGHAWKNSEYPITQLLH